MKRTESFLSECSEEERFILRLPKNLAEELTVLAKENKMSRNELVVRLLTSSSYTLSAFGDDFDCIETLPENKEDRILYLIR